jgi:carbon-monoxide dehydrogenase small subunit
MIVSLTINGQNITADIAPRTHLADFLREQRLLTGTHLGCEHGVCGACTLLIDDAPARSCIAFAAVCAGATVTTIEGLEHDPVIIRLRAAFTAEHALQCGYCTPGMLVTARDIVLRLPDADAARIRLELAGNLCRCTGYAGIVRAIQRVLREAPAQTLTRLAPLATLSRNAGEGPSSAESLEPLSRTAREGEHLAASTEPLSRTAGEEGARRESDGMVRAATPTIDQRLRLALPAATIWQALQDPTLVANCIPGATLTSRDDNRISGAMQAALGPIRARFTGIATLSYGPDYTGTITGEGQDSASATRLNGQARFTVVADGDSASTLDLAITYALRGPLAQFARGPVVQDFAAEITQIFVRNLEATLTGRAAAPAKPLGLVGLMWRVLRRRVGRWFGTA